MATLEFDANKVDPAEGFEPIPAGKYVAVIVDSQMKPTKNGGGKYLELKFQVLDGPYKGRFLWSRLNLENPNALAVQIAKGELSAICRAVGVMTPRDSVELHNLPLQITVKCRKRDDVPGGELTNEIKGYAKKDASPTGPAVSGGQATTASGGSAPPWRRS